MNPARHVGWGCGVGWHGFAGIETCDAPEEDTVVELLGGATTATAGFGKDEIVVEAEARGWMSGENG